LTFFEICVTEIAVIERYRHREDSVGKAMIEIQLAGMSVLISEHGVVG
jgi:hypothetical protein